MLYCKTHEVCGSHTKRVGENKSFYNCKSSQTCCSLVLSKNVWAGVDQHQLPPRNKYRGSDKHVRSTATKASFVCVA